MIIAQTENIENGMHPESRLVFEQIDAAQYLVGFMLVNGMMSDIQIFNDYKDAENSYNIRKIIEE